MLKLIQAEAGRLVSSESFVGAARLAGGTGAGQVILVAVSPFLTRLYTPSEFGSLAIFISIVGLLIAISAGGYHFAIMLPDRMDDANVVLGLSLVMVAFTTVVTAIIAVIFMLFGIFDDALGGWILVLPLAVLFGGAAQVMAAYAVRSSEYGLVARANLLKALITGSVQIVLAFVGLGAGGLIGGHCLGMASASVKLGRLTMADLRQIRPSVQNMRVAARNHEQFPKYTLPSNLVNLGFLSGTPLVISWLFDTVTLGFWSLANSFVYMPSVLISQAVSQVYYRKAVALRSSRQEAVKLFDRTVMVLAVGSCIPFVAMAVAAPHLFSFVFGEKWRVAGQYAQLMLPAVWVRFVTAPVSTTTMAHGANRVTLFTSALQIVAVALTVSGTLANNMGPTGFLILFSTLLALVQVLSLVLFRRSIKGDFRS